MQGETYKGDSHHVVLNRQPYPKAPCPAAEPVGIALPLRPAALAVTTGITLVFSGTTDVIQAIGARVARTLLGTAAIASSVHCLPNVSAPVVTAGVGVSVLGGSRTASPSSSDESNRTIYRLLG